MNRESTKKNIAYQMIYELLIILLPIITSPYIARVVGPEGLGTYSYYYSIAYYFYLFALLGIKNYGNRTIAIARDDRQRLNCSFSGILFLHILLATICIAVYLVYIAFFANEKIYATIMILLVLSALLDISWFYFGIERFKITVSVNSFLKILSTVLIFILINDSSDLWIYCLIIAGSSLLSQLLLWIPLNKYVSIVKVNRQEIFCHFKPFVILFIPAIAVSLYKYMDKIMIGTLSTKTQLGFYENSEKIINIPLTMIGSFGTVMLPKMSNLFNRNTQDSLKTMEISMKYILGLGLGLAAGLAGISIVFAPVFWGDKFSGCATLITGLALTLPFNTFANVIRTQYLIPKMKDKEYTITVFTGAIINLIINYLLIKKYEAIGAVIATIIAEVFVCTFQVSFVRRELPITTYLKNSIPFVIIASCMFLIVRLIGSILGTSTFTLIVQIVAGGFFYLLACSLYLWRCNDPIFADAIHRLHNLKGKMR